MEIFKGYQKAFIWYDPATEKPRADGKRKPEIKTKHEPITQADFERHKAGKISVGVSPLREDETVSWGVLDFDSYAMKDEQLKKIAKALGPIMAAYFRSKSMGLHVFIFVEVPVPAADMQLYLESLLKRIPKKVRGKTEVFPKQVEIEPGATPTAVNLPMFGASRQLIGGRGRDGPFTGKQFADLADEVIPYLEQHVVMTAEEWVVTYARALEQAKSGPVREHTPVGFKEPDQYDGRQDFLFRCACSMQTRGGEDKDIRAQVEEINDTYQARGHPAFEQGKISADRVKSAIASALKYKKGIPSGLNFNVVEEFNEDFGILNVDGKIEVVDLTRVGEFITYAWDDFTRWVRPRRVPTQKGSVEISKLWECDSDRREYSGVKIEPATYKGKSFNLHRGFEREPLEGDASLFIDGYLRDIYCSGDAELFEWVTHWLADLVQNPTECGPTTAIMSQGGQGQGKTFLFAMLHAFMGRSAVLVSSSDRLFSRFNRRLAGIPLLGCDEAFFSRDNELADKLKNLISSTEWDYEEKFRMTLPLKNVHRILGSTNKDHAVMLESDDRRWTIVPVETRWNIDTPEGKAEAYKFWQPFYDMLRSDDGPGRVYNYFQDLKFDRQLITYPLMNKRKAEDKRSSDPVLQVLDDAAHSGVLLHDIRAHGMCSFSSLLEAVRDAGGYAVRNMSQGDIKSRVLKLVNCRTTRKAMYLENPQRADDGSIGYTCDNSRKRGLEFEDLTSFRKQVALITQEDYFSGDIDDWQEWGVKGVTRSGGDLEEAVRRFANLQDYEGKSTG